jgi:hypothetical protein
MFNPMDSSNYAYGDFATSVEKDTISTLAFHVPDPYLIPSVYLRQ